MSNKKVNASEKVVQLEPPLFIMFSEMPMMNEPTTAPGILPMPPNTAATKHFKPGALPEMGVTEA